MRTGRYCITRANRSFFDLLGLVLLLIEKAVLSAVTKAFERPGFPATEPCVLNLFHWV